MDAVRLSLKPFTELVNVELIKHQYRKECVALEHNIQINLLSRRHFFSFQSNVSIVCTSEIWISVAF